MTVDLLAEARAILNRTDLDGNVQTLIISTDALTGETIGSVRNENGYPILAPHPESQSMLVGSMAYFLLLTRGPTIIEHLLNMVESSENNAVSARNEPESVEIEG